MKRYIKSDDSFNRDETYEYGYYNNTAQDRQHFIKKFENKGYTNIKVRRVATDTPGLQMYEISYDRPSTSVTSATNLMHKKFIIPEFQIAQAFSNYLDSHNIQYDAWNETGNYYIECDITFNELFGINNFLSQFGKIEMAGDKTSRLVVKNSSKFRR